MVQLRSSLAQPSFASSLHWLRGEMDQCLVRVRNRLEIHLEGADGGRLDAILGELRQVHGALSLIRCGGGALLAGEMFETAARLVEGHCADTDAACGALLGATLQLADYFDALAGGSEDCVLVLQALINELRVARGAPMLGEAELFAAQLALVGVQLPLPPGRDAAVAQAMARRCQPAVQQAMLQWLKNEDVRGAVARLGKAGEYLAQTASSASLHQLWRVLSGCAEGVLQERLEASLELKRLVGRAVQQIRRTAEAGEEAAAAQAEDLAFQLLLHLGRSRAQGVRVTFLRRAFELDRRLPSAAALDAMARQLRGPNTQLLQRLSDEIRADLTDIKDAIDLVVRAGARANADLGRTAERLHKLSNTLAMLGLSVLQRVVHTQAEAVARLAAMTEAPAGSWMDVATALLRVENSLDAALFRQLRRAGGETPPGQYDEATPPSADFDEGLVALLRESLVNLARFKSATDQALRNGVHDGVAGAAGLLGEIRAGLTVLDEDRAAGLVAELLRYSEQPGFPAAVLRHGQAECFADAVACLEFLLEALQSRSPDADAVLDDLASYVERLEFADTLPPAVEAPPPAARPLDEVDPEIREVFVEEAGEVLETLRRHLDAWRREPADMARLLEIRRAFHTLKGSGRMVGANLIGEFGWACENLLNQCRDGAMSAGAAVVETIVEAIALLPGLIDAFRDGQAPPEGVETLIGRAETLAGASGAASDMRAVFVADARGLLDEVQGWLGRCERSQALHAPDDDVLRVFHTLRGSAALVGHGAIAALASALEQYFESLRRAQQWVPAAALAVLDDVVPAAREWLGRTPPPSAEVAAGWLARVAELQASLPDEAVAAAGARQLTDLFTHEVFGLAEQVEAALAQWRAQPRQRQHLGQAVVLLQQMRAAAQAAGEPVVDTLSAALAGGFETPSPPDAPPDALFDQGVRVLEAIYQRLDALRDGRPGPDPEAVLAPLSLGVAPAAVPVPQEPETTVSSEAGTHESAAPAVLAEETTFGGPPAAPEPPPGDALPAAAEPDPELARIFLGEAADLLALIEARLSMQVSEPWSQTPDAELQRAWHTLKGSARMAGFAELAELALDGERLAADPPAVGAEGLSELAGRLRTRLAALGAAAAMPTAAPPAAPWPPTPPAAAAPDDEDSELLEVFRAEASELLDKMESTLGAWRGRPDNELSMLELQRILHTLKGGARMAGLSTMGATVHEMESLVEDMARGELPSDELAFDQLQTRFEQLQHMHDRLARGESLTADEDDEQPIEAPYEWTPPAEPATPPPEQAAPPPDPPADADAPPWDPQLFWNPEDEAGGWSAPQRELARVPVERLDELLNQASESAIFRSRLEQHNVAIGVQLAEMAETIGRLREQLRRMDIETEAQIAARGLRGPAADPEDRYGPEFDPLEMDRYTRMQELARALSESVGDLASLHASLAEVSEESGTLLQQQGRVNTAVQQGLMGTLMVPFSRQIGRLQRLVRQTAAETGKQVETRFDGAEAELDRKVLERMTVPLEHVLRNAVVHGIEPPAVRAGLGKPETGSIEIGLRRDGTQLIVDVRDDGRGLDISAIREQAVQRGLMLPNVELTELQIAQFIFEPGFSTARELTQSAGRGIGMDVVASEVKQLGGTLDLETEAGGGTRFEIRLPLTLAVSQALLVTVGGELYAVPLSSIEGVARVQRAHLDQYFGDSDATLAYGGADYPLRYLGDYLGLPRVNTGDTRTVPAILLRVPEGIGGDERRLGLVVDGLLGNRELVTKTVGPQVSSIVGIVGATILADGAVVLILDVLALVQDRTRRALLAEAQSAAAPHADSRATVMVVDDSVTMRRVAERLLSRHGYRVLTARDGLDAMAQLATEQPGVILLDIEMPRADGFEVAAFVRNSARIREVPIIMITSRSGDKHRQRALALGVDRYLIKPYQEDQLLSEIREVLR